MNEHELQGLLKDYGDSLSTSRRPSSRRPARRGRLTYAIVCGIAAVAIAVAMWPQNASAGRIRRMGQAIKNARTMEMNFWRQTPSGAWLDFMHVFYEDGMWRSEMVKGAGQAATIVTRDSLMLLDYHRLDHATLMREPKDALPDGEKSALDYAKTSIDSGQASIERTMSVRDHADVAGRTTYLLVFDRKEDSYHAELVVDAATDLPISAEIRVHYDGENGGDFRYRQDYRFNQTFDSDLFALKSAKPVVDLRNSTASLEKRWPRPLAKIGDMELREASATSDGTIWLAITCSEAEQPTLPIRLSTSTGTNYVRLWDFASSPMSGDSASIKVGGQTVLMVGFVPLDPLMPRPVKATIFFGRRPVSLPNFAKKPGWDSVATSDEATVRLKPVDTQVPTYFPLLNMDRMTLELPADIWHKRGEGLEKEGKLLDAAHAFERSAKEFENFVKYIGYRELDRAAQCYDKLGMAKEAADNQAKSAILKAARER